MPAQLNHTIVHAHDKTISAKFLSEMLDLPSPQAFHQFLVVETSNGVSLDFIDAGESAFERQHFAFLVNDAEFDAIFTRIKARKLKYWADPMCWQEGQINTHFGGRGLYFRDPAGHLLEIITKPYTVA